MTDDWRFDAWHCAVPMPHPVRLGAMEYRTRDYVVLRVTDADGRVSSAVGYSRGTPLLEATRIVCAQADLRLADDPEALTDDLHARFAVGWASLVRGASLLDIALWRRRAAINGTTVGVALGGTETDRADLHGAEADATPWIGVGGYFPDARSRGELVDELRRFAADGASGVKLMLSVTDPDGDRALVAAARAALGGLDIAVDFHGGHREPREAAAALARLDDEGLVFLEDPFPGHDLARLRELADLVDVPLAVGEDLVEESTVDALLDIAGVLRVDATSSGGLSFARRAVRRATSAGRAVIPHVFEDTHRPLASLSSAVAAIERIPPGVGADPIDRLDSWSAVAAMVIDGWHLARSVNLR
jgi:L-alanine-DL-glutamate epimerase-like enolase superfamily enzyme